MNRKTIVDGRTRYEKICVFCGKEVVFFHGRKPSRCPHCNSNDYVKSPTESKLFKLQRKYFLEDKNKEYLSEMFVILKSYATSIIKKLLPSDFKYHYNKIEEKAQDAASIFIENYLSRPDFVIDNSFGFYLTCKVKEVLWNKKDQIEDQHDSIDRSFGESVNDDTGKNIMDISDIIHIAPIYGTYESHTNEIQCIDNDDLVIGIEKVIENIAEALKNITTWRNTYAILLGICLLIEGKTITYMDKYYHFFGSDLKDQIDTSMLLIYRFIKEWE